MAKANEPGLRVMGLDPGLERTGYGVIDVGGARPWLVEAGILRIPTSAPLSHRLLHLYRGALELIELHRPTAIAVEELYSHYERPRTAILMGHARGVLLLAAAQSGVSVAGYAATRVKKCMTGSGQATKEQMQRAVQLEFGLETPPKPPDVADALAIALCHHHDQRLAGRAPRAQAI